MAKGMDYREWHSIRGATDIKVGYGSLGLCTPVFVGRYIDRAKGVSLLAMGLACGGGVGHDREAWCMAETARME